MNEKKAKRLRKEIYNAYKTKEHERDGGDTTGTIGGVDEASHSGDRKGDVNAIRLGGELGPTSPGSRTRRANKPIGARDYTRTFYERRIARVGSSGGAGGRTILLRLHRAPKERAVYFESALKTLKAAIGAAVDPSRRSRSGGTETPNPFATEVGEIVAFTETLGPGAQRAYKTAKLNL